MASGFRFCRTPSLVQIYRCNCNDDDDVFIIVVVDVVVNQRFMLDATFAERGKGGLSERCARWVAFKVAKQTIGRARLGPRI